MHAADNEHLREQEVVNIKNYHAEKLTFKRNVPVSQKRVTILFLGKWSGEVTEK